MNYQETVKYLESLIPKEFRMELEPLAEVCARLGNPQKNLKTVHVCGTNGKGSTASFTASILQASGFKVGLYVSPHLQTLRERIQINRDLISPERLVAFTEFIRGHLKTPDELSFFEFMTLMSFLHFAEQKVDIAVYETGLGGRLDATNLITPLVTVMTPVNFDHMHLLGNTLTDIAREKCGIMKPGVPMVIAQQAKEVEEVVRSFAARLDCQVVHADPKSITQPLGLMGEHQKQNAACAVEAVKLLSDHGFAPLRMEVGLAKAYWPGRLERVQMYPTVILDGAHNPHGMEAVAKYLDANWPKEKVVLLFTAMRDKNIPDMLKTILPRVREIHLTTLPEPRAATPEELETVVAALGYPVKKWHEDSRDMIANLRSQLDTTDLLLVTGSLHLIGFVRNCYFQLEKV